MSDLPILVCPHMAQRVDSDSRFWCVDCGAYCGRGEWVALDEPLVMAEVEAMREHWRAEMQRRDDDQA